MTQLSQKTVSCPNCGAKNRIFYYASINTFLDFDGNLISKVLDGTINTSLCKNCGERIRLANDILINSPKGMFYLNPKDNLEYKKQKLESYEVLSEKGVIISGLVSQYIKAKNKINKKKQYSPPSKPPPAPKVTPQTKKIHELIENLDKKLSKGKKYKEEEDDKFINGSSAPPAPPPPPPKS
jgi:hypothetical protein